jgi:hypothetical protein
MTTAPTLDGDAIEPRAFDGERVGVARVGRARKAAWAAAGFFGALTLGAPGVSVDLVAVTLPACALALVALVVVGHREPSALKFARSPGRVVVDGGRVTVTAKGVAHAFTRGDVVEGWLEPLAHEAVVLRLASGDVVGFDVGDEARAKRLLEELGVSPAQRTVRVRLASPASQRRFGRALSVALLFVLGAFGLTNTLLLAVEGVLALLRDGPVGIAMLLVALPLLLLVLAAMSLAAQYLARPLAVIGADGLDVRSFLRRRFVPLASVASVDFDGRRVQLALVDGRAIALAPSTAEAGELLEARLREALGAARSGVAEAKLALLDRAGATVDAWRARLVELSSASGYRDVRLDASDLYAVLEDAKCPRERRVAAAFTLASRGGDGAHRRLRVVAAGCASESLRVSLERAAEGELEAEEDADARARLA